MFKWKVHFTRRLKGVLLNEVAIVRAWSRKGAKKKWLRYVPVCDYYNYTTRG